MTPADAGDRLRLMFDWAHDGRRRLALWLLAALALHAVGYALFRITYPRPQPARISDASLYVLAPGSPDAARLAPFLASNDPAIFAPERDDRIGRPDPAIPAYQPSYASASPEIVPLPDPQPRILPPLLQNFGPVAVEEPPAAPTSAPAPAINTAVRFSDSLKNRAPDRLPKAKFSARPGDQLSPSRFLLAVAPDGRVLHVLPDGPSRNEALEDAASRLLMQIWFQRGPHSEITWGVATFDWGLDVKREEPR